MSDKQDYPSSDSKYEYSLSGEDNLLTLDSKCNVLQKNVYDDPPPEYKPQLESSKKRLANMGPEAKGVVLRVMKAGKEPALELLGNFDTVVLVDDSGSMGEAVSAGAEKTRWTAARDVLKLLAPVITAYDADGIDIHFLNHVPSEGSNLNLKKEADVVALFDQVVPYGGTPTAERLEDILSPYLEELSKYGAPEETQKNIKGQITERKKRNGVLGRLLGRPKPKENLEKPPKGMNILFITDGCPFSMLAVNRVIKHTAQVLQKGRWPANQLGIQFVQVGDDKAAGQWLEMLDGDKVGDDANDNEKRKAMDMDFARDIIDTRRYSDGGELSTSQLVEMLCGSINRVIDNRGAPYVVDKSG